MGRVRGCAGSLPSGPDAIHKLLDQLGVLLALELA